MVTQVSGRLAVIFDFDDTLVPDSTTALLAEHSVDTKAFWGTHVKSLVEEGYDPAMAWLKLLLDQVGAGKPLGQLTKKDLGSFGAGLDSRFYSGIPGVFGDLRDIVGAFEDQDLEFFIVSGGLEDIMLGSKIVGENFKAVYGCRLAEDPSTGELRHVRRAVTFTEKTRYLFEINKGIGSKASARNPYLVNKKVGTGGRRVPFSNMIYIGDGLTDIPCFSLVQKEGGVAFGVFEPGNEDSAKRAFVELLRPSRVVSMHAPKYGKEDELGSLLRIAVTSMCQRIEVERREA